MWVDKKNMMFTNLFTYIFTIKEGEVACCGNIEPKFDQPDNNKTNRRK